MERCAETGGNVKTLVDAVYMAVISFSTVGFGDFTPDTKAGNWLVAQSICLLFFKLLYLLLHKTFELIIVTICLPHVVHIIGMVLEPEEGSLLAW